MATIIVIIIFVFCVLLSYQLGYEKAVNKIKEKLYNYKEIENEKEVKKIKNNNKIVNDVLLMSANSVDELLKKIAVSDNNKQ